MTYTDKSRRKAQATILNKYKELNPGLSDEAALLMYHEDLRKRASNGGKKTSGYAFAHGKVDPAEASRLRKKR